MNDIPRHLEPQVDELLKQFPAVILVGARQVGKTSLAKKIRPNWAYFDLEKPTDFDRITRDPVFFFENHPDAVILDEAQESHELFKCLRGVIDAQRQKKNRFLLTGSSSPLLIERVSESLAGRVAVLEVGTLKMTEFYKQPLSPFYDFFASKLSPVKLLELTPRIPSGAVRDFWVRGGYPEPVLAEDEAFWFSWMENYFQTYLNRDIRKLFPRLDLIRFRRFVSVLAKLSGQYVNKAQMASAIEVSEPVIRDYIDIVDGTFLWRKLPSFESSADKLISKAPKGYLRDSGLLHYLLRLSTLEDILNDPMAGFSFESFVVEEILKGLTARGIQNWEASSYRTRNRSEVDLILKGFFGILPIEIKLGNKLSSRSTVALRNFMVAHKLSFGLVVYSADKVDWIENGILGVPVGCL